MYYIKIAAWIGPIHEFALAHVRHINAWIIAQYGMTRVEVENVIDNDWLHQLLTNGCPYDAIGLIASTASANSTKAARRMLTYQGYDRVQSYRAQSPSLRPLMCLRLLTVSLAYKRA
jgi:hypothetical protein